MRKTGKIAATILATMTTTSCGIRKLYDGMTHDEYYTKHASQLLKTIKENFSDDIQCESLCYDNDKLVNYSIYNEDHSQHIRFRNIHFASDNANTQNVSITYSSDTNVIFTEDWCYSDYTIFDRTTIDYMGDLEKLSSLIKNKTFALDKIVNEQTNETIFDASQTMDMEI